MKQTQNLKDVIDLKKLKKYLLKNFGKRCPEVSWLCATCEVWKVYDELEIILKF